MTVDQQSRAVRSTETSQAPTRYVTLENVYVFGAVAIATAAALSTVVRPHDFWWHLAMGRTIVTSSVFPTVDTFTYTRDGAPFFNQMWLAQAWMYLLHRAGGVYLTVVAHAATIGVAYALLLRLCIRLSNRKKLSALVLLALVLPLSFSNWAVRPQPYAFPLFVIFLTVLLRPRSSDGRRRLESEWVLPPLMALWVNIHGSFVLGLGLVTLALLVEAGPVLAKALDGQSPDTSGVRRLGLTALFTWAATMLNPRGFEVLSYVATLTTNDAVATVSEWQPLAPTDVTGVLYFAFCGLLILSLVYGRRRPTPRETVMVTGLMLLGFTARRHTTWFVFAAAPILCMQLASMLRPRRAEAGSPIANGIVMAGLAVVLVGALPWVREAIAPPPINTIVRETPVKAAEELASLPSRPSRLFNDLGYGSYLAWQLPAQKTFIDTRFELFPLQQVEDYRHLSLGRDVERLTDTYGIDGFLISHKYQPRLIRALRDEREWRLEYSDDEAVIFLPRDG